MLTKRSTYVDQNIRSDKVVSQLSVTIFVTPRTYLVAQKSIIYKKKVKKSVNPWHPPLFTKTRDIARLGKVGGGLQGLTDFLTFFGI